MVNTVDKVLIVAKTEEGYLEKKSNSNLYDKTKNAGYNNYTKYWQDLKPSFQGQPWCNAFINWIFVQAYGLENAKKLLCTSGEWSYYTPTSAQYFKNKGQWSNSPKVGSPIYFKNSTRIYHVGIVYKVDSKYVYTIEGNTSSSGANYVEANGGAVCKKYYALTYSKIAGYGHPKYDELANSSQLLSSFNNLSTYDIKTGINGLTTCVEGKLNIRDYPATGNVVDVLIKGDIIYPIKKTFVNDNPWFYIKDKGWVSGKYFDGWVQESDGRWWYLLPNYAWYVGLHNINETLYYFDADGYLVENDKIDIGDDSYFANSDGSIMTDSWIKYDGKWYYAGEDGKFIKEKYLLKEGIEQELFYFNGDGSMFEGVITLHTNQKGVLETGV